MALSMTREAARASYPEIGQLIGGELITAGGNDLIRVEDPCSGEELTRFAPATPAHIEQALAAAEAGFKQWRATPAMTRGAILVEVARQMRARKEALAAVMVLEEGKPFADALVEVEQAAGMWEWAGEEGKRLYGRIIPAREANSKQMVLHEPVGVVAAFPAWNGPMVNPARKFSASLGAGCAVILKAPEEAPGSTLMMAQIALEAGVPPQALTVLVGDAPMISTALIAADTVRAISFTGSVQVGKILAQAAAARMKRAVLELGGHAPVLVFDDVDVEKVAAAAVTIKFRNAGQNCGSPSRFLVQRGIYDAFAAAMAKAADKIEVGCGFDASTVMGPLIHNRRRTAIRQLIQDAQAKGATLLAGGDASEARGYFHRPTILGGVSQSADVSCHEPFGPIAALSAFDTMEEALSIANRLPYGLGAYVHTRNLQHALQAVDSLEAGNVIVNHWRVSLPETPFGGVKDSGMFSEGGQEGLRAFLTTKYAYLA